MDQDVGNGCNDDAVDREGAPSAVKDGEEGLLARVEVYLATARGRYGCG